MKDYTLSSVSIERVGDRRYAWLYLHPNPPKKEDFEAAADFAVLLKRLPGSGAVVSGGDGLDLEYCFGTVKFRYAFDGIHGMAIECDYDDLPRVRSLIDGLCDFGEESRQEG